MAAAVDAGADLVEFDVCEGLVVGHSRLEAGEDAPSLDAALDLLRRRGVAAHIDLKVVGAEDQLAAAVRRHGLEECALVSSNSVRSLRRLSVEAPALTRAISYPRDRYGASGIGWPKGFVSASAAALRPTMRFRLLPLLSAAQAGVLSLHHTLVSAPLVAAVHARGAAVLAWTVNDPAEVVWLAEIGVDAIVSDDPGMAVGVLATLREL
jgi:glycerophosphoryl diester phosphodiesterase